MENSAPGGQARRMQHVADASERRKTPRPEWVEGQKEDAGPRARSRGAKMGRPRFLPSGGGSSIITGGLSRSARTTREHDRARGLHGCGNEASSIKGMTPGHYPKLKRNARVFPFESQSMQQLQNSTKHGNLTVTAATGVVNSFTQRQSPVRNCSACALKITGVRKERGLKGQRALTPPN